MYWFLAGWFPPRDNSETPVKNFYGVFCVENGDKCIAVEYRILSVSRKNIN